MLIFAATATLITIVESRRWGDTIAARGIISAVEAHDDA